MWCVPLRRSLIVSRALACASSQTSASCSSVCGWGVGAGPGSELGRCSRCSVYMSLCAVPLLALLQQQLRVVSCLLPDSAPPGFLLPCPPASRRRGAPAVGEPGQQPGGRGVTHQDGQQVRNPPWLAGWLAAAQVCTVPLAVAGGRSSLPATGPLPSHRAANHLSPPSRLPQAERDAGAGNWARALRGCIRHSAQPARPGRVAGGAAHRHQGLWCVPLHGGEIW